MSRNIIAILRGIKPDEALEATQELIECGITKIEVPLNSPDAIASISLMANIYGEDALIGAGTVLNVKDVNNVRQVGGKFIVSPDCNSEVIVATKAADMLSYPGVMTPSECFLALRSGADSLKLFPGNLIGPDGLRALRAVLSKDVEIFAVGGCDIDNFADWKNAGANGFGIGSALYKPGFSSIDIRNRAKRIVAVYDQVFGYGL